MNEAVENVKDNTVVTSKQEETKAEKFIRLGEYRMNKAMDAIGRLEHLANKSAYEYTPEQVEAMFSTLELRVADVKAKFTVTKTRENATFSFGTISVSMYFLLISFFLSSWKFFISSLIFIFFSSS